MNEQNNKNYEVKKFDENQPIKYEQLEKKSLDNNENINKNNSVDINSKNKETKEDIIQIDLKDMENNNNKSAYETKLNVKQNVDSTNFVDEPDELSQKKEEKKIQDEKKIKILLK